MRLILGTSALSSITSVSSWRLRLVPFEVRIWRLYACPRLILPVPVFLKRLAAPLCVFIFGIVFFYYNINARTPPAAMLSPCRPPAELLLLLLRRRCGWNGRLLRLRTLRLRFCLGRLGRSLRLRRCQDQMQSVAFLSGSKFHDPFIAEVFDQAFQNFASQSLARHLASAEEDGRLHLVAFGEEAQHVVLLGLVVVIVHVDAELHFLDRDLVLVLLGLALALFLLVQVFPVIHDPANRRLSSGRDFHQVEGFLAGDLERVVRRHDTKLVAFIVDHANFACTNALIGADKTFIDTVLRSNC